VSATPATVLFAAKKTSRHQSPPHERIDADPEILLLRWYRDGEELWRFPIVGEFERLSDSAEPWTDGVDLVRLDARFEPPVPARDYMWVHPDLVVHNTPDIFHHSVQPAVRRLGGPLLDQIMARFEARADTTIKLGDIRVTTESRADFIAAQSRASRLLQAFGDSAGADPFLQGESLLQYRARLATQFQKYSSKCKEVNLDRVGDLCAFGAIEAAIYNDALSEASHPTQITAGVLIPRRTRDNAGREITRYIGDPNACWDQFNPPVRHVRRFMTPGRAA